MTLDYTLDSLSESEKGEIVEDISIQLDHQGSTDMLKVLISTKLNLAMSKTLTSSGSSPL